MFDISNLRQVAESVSEVGHRPFREVFVAKDDLDLLAETQPAFSEVFSQQSKITAEHTVEPKIEPLLNAIELQIRDTKSDFPPNSLQNLSDGSNQTIANGITQSLILAAQTEAQPENAHLQSQGKQHTEQDLPHGISKNTSKNLGSAHFTVPLKTDMEAHSAKDLDPTPTALRLQDRSSLNGQATKTTAASDALAHDTAAIMRHVPEFQQAEHEPVDPSVAAEEATSLDSSDLNQKKPNFAQNTFTPKNLHSPGRSMDVIEQQDLIETPKKQLGSEKPRYALLADEPAPTTEPNKVIRPNLPAIPSGSPQTSATSFEEPIINGARLNADAPQQKLATEPAQVNDAVILSSEPNSTRPALHLHSHAKSPEFLKDFRLVRDDAVPAEPPKESTGGAGVPADPESLLDRPLQATHNATQGPFAVVQMSPAGQQSVNTSIQLQIIESIRSAASKDIEVRLEPEELGKLRILLSPRESGLHVLIMADRPETLDLMRRNSEDLAGYLADGGYDESTIDFGHFPDPKDPPDQSEIGLEPTSIEGRAKRSAMTISDGHGLDIRI